MNADRSVLDVLALPAAALERTNGPAMRDAIAYFVPDLIVIPGGRTATGYATVRTVAADVPVLHPQLGRSGDRIRHLRYSSATGVCREVPAESTSRDAIDLLAVQTGTLLDQLHTRLESAAIKPCARGATYVFVPDLAVDWDAVALTTTLPHADDLAGIAAARPEPVTVLAGGQPATYRHVWTLRHDGEDVIVPIVGLGATDRDQMRFTRLPCTDHGGVGAESVAADRFGLRALHGVGAATASRLRNRGCETVRDVLDLDLAALTALPGIGRVTAERILEHAAVIDSGEVRLLADEPLVGSGADQPPLCLDIETDGLTPTIIWQIGVYDPAADEHHAFIETETPNDPATVLDSFLTWLLGTHPDRALLTWNGHAFDYPQLDRFVGKHLPAYHDAWTDRRRYDLYQWAVRDERALLPGRTNRLDHVARALGYPSADTGLTGAQTAAAYRAFMRDRSAVPDWDRHRAYCEDDCRALWHVYRAIADAPRRSVTTPGTASRQTGLADF